MGERELAEKIRKEDREYRVRENRKNQRELAQILFVGIKAGTELREPRDPRTGERETKKAGPKERSVHLLQRTGALEKRVP